MWNWHILVRAIVLTPIRISSHLHCWSSSLALAYVGCNHASTNTPVSKRPQKKVPLERLGPHRRDEAAFLCFFREPPWRLINTHRLIVRGRNTMERGRENRRMLTWRKSLQQYLKYPEIYLKTFWINSKHYT